MTLIPNAFSTSALLFVLLLVCWIDVRERRIPNRIVLSGLIAAIGIAAMTSGVTGVASALTGTAIGGGLLLPFYMAGGMGAGDVKLMAMTGAYLGTKLTAVAVVLTVLSGAIAGFVLLCAWQATRSGDGSDERTPGIPYAVAILIGACATLAWHFQFQSALL